MERKPLIDERIPRPFREMIKELKGIRGLLEELKERLAVPIPAVPPVRIPPIIAKAPVVTLTGQQFMKILVDASKRFGALAFSDDLYVETVDLSEERTEPKEFPHLKGVALTIFRNTGTFDLYINKMSDDHKVTFDALTYPQTFLLDWFKLKSIWIANTAQSGLEAVLISWKRSLLRR